MREFTMAKTRFNVICRVLLVAQLAITIISRPAVAEDKAVPDSGDIEQRIHRVVNGLRPAVIVAGQAPMELATRMSELHVPGVSVAVLHDGTIQWARGFGSVSIGGLPVMTDTLFQAGSISKPVSAVAALRLAQAGKLDLDADVDLVLKSWKLPANSYTNESRVTLRRLLNHSAGISVHGFPGYAAGRPVPSLIDVLNGMPPANTAPIVVDHRPGERFQYSGGGYTIMQQMLTDLTGQPFPELLADTVLKPFGMINSSFHQPLSANEAQLAATPYRGNGTPIEGGAHTYPELAAAGLWTTPTDLSHFALALLDAWAGRNNPVLSQSTIAQMLTPGFGDYGLGPIVRGSPPNRHFRHDGVNAGFVNAMIAFESGDGAVVMTNSAAGWQLAGEVLRSIAAEYRWPAIQAKVRQRINVSPQTLERLVGTYELTPKFRIRISKDGERLFAQATGQERFEVFPETDRDFFYSVVDAVLTFDADGQGGATQLILHQDGKDRVAKRVP
jgi:CubicO group peptidase (beta-lactamase class C family)